MAASKRELQALIVLAGKIDPSLRKALAEANSKTKDLGQSTKLFGDLATKAWNAMKIGAAAGAVAIGAGLAFVAKKGIELASDLSEVQNVVDVTFGQNADLINKWAKDAKTNFGLSELAAKRFASTMGAMLKSTGIAEEHIVSMSTTLAGLSADFASFYNSSPEEAFEKIRAGISGETEPLKAWGINLSVANLEAYRLAKGIKVAYEKMSAADQAILRYNYLLEVSKDAQGDFNRNIGSFANQMRVLRTNFQEVAAKIMSGVIPALEQLLKKANQLAQEFLDDPEQIGKISDAISQTFTKAIELIPTAAEYAKKFALMIGDVAWAAYRVYEFITKNWRWIKPTILGIVGAMVVWKTVTAGMTVIKTITEMVKGLRTALTFLTIAKWKDVGATIYLQALYAKDAVVKAASTAATWAMTAATKAWTVVAQIGAVTARALGAAIAFITSPAGLVILAIGALVAASIWLYNNWDKVSKFLADSWEWIKQAFATGVNWVVDKLNWLIEKANKIPGIEIPLIPKLDTDAYNAAAAAQGSETLQGFSKGGIATQPSIFGEDGPEMAIPLKRTPRSLGLLNQTARILGVDNIGGSGNGGGNITFVYSPTYGAGITEAQVRQDFEEFKRMIEKWWAEKGRESFA